MSQQEEKKRLGACEDRVRKLTDVSAARLAFLTCDLGETTLDFDQKNESEAIKKELSTIGIYLACSARQHPHEQFRLRFHILVCPHAPGESIRSTRRLTVLPLGGIIPTAIFVSFLVPVKTCHLSIVQVEQIWASHQESCLAPRSQL